jgi:hypothetical protein
MNKAKFFRALGILTAASGMQSLSTFLPANAEALATANTAFSSQNTPELISQGTAITVESSHLLQDNCDPLSGKVLPVKGTESRYGAAYQLSSCRDPLGNIITTRKEQVAPLLDAQASLDRRLDEINKRIEKLKYQQFSPTTRLTGIIFDAINTASFSTNSQATYFNSSNKGNYEGTYNNYTLLPMLFTSFTGTDLLTIIGLASNYSFANASCGGGPSFAMAQTQCGALYPTDTLGVWRAYYTYKVNKNISVTAGPSLYAYDFLPIGNAVYSPKGGNVIGLRSVILDIIQYAGVPGVYPYALGAGGGISWHSNGWSLATGFLAQNGRSSTFTGGTSGMFGPNNGGSGVAQLAYTSRKSGFQAAWTGTRYLANSGQFFYLQGTPLALNPFGNLATGGQYYNIYYAVDTFVNTYAAGGYYYITPNLSISGGANFAQYLAGGSSSSNGYSVTTGDSAVTAAWVATLQWEKAITDSGSLALSFGQPAHVISNQSNFGTDVPPNMIALLFNWAFSNNINVSSTIYYMANIGGSTYRDTNVLGSTLMATFMF